MRTLSLMVSFLVWSSVSLAADNGSARYSAVFAAKSTATGFEQVFNGHDALLYLAENTEGNGTDKPEPGSLVIPGEEKNEAEKKCLNVCKKWGEDCIINPRTGQRNCRRTCKDFGMECF